LPNSEDVSATSLVLPMYHEMTVEDQDRVVAALGRACR
jgi:dTDP-4-amino-4,6-dideoxygalactose transaminase